MKKVMWRTWSQIQRAKGLLSREEGQGMVEYGLILALIAVVVVAVLVGIGGNLNSMFGTVNKDI